MHLITHNFWWKLLSLLGGFLIWLSIGNDPDLATSFSAPVQYLNYPKDLEISSPIVDSLDIDVRGPAGQLRDLRTARLSAIVDFSSVRVPGERTFTITAKEVRLPRGVELVRTVPAQLRFIFEGRTSRDLKVDVQFSGALRRGLSLAGFEAFPRALTITGPESRVRTAKNAITDPIDLSQLTGDTMQNTAVYVAEPEVRFTRKPEVTVKVHVVTTH